MLLLLILSYHYSIFYLYFITAFSATTEIFCWTFPDMLYDVCFISTFTSNGTLYDTTLCQYLYRFNIFISFCRAQMASLTVTTDNDGRSDSQACFISVQLNGAWSYLLVQFSTCAGRLCKWCQPPSFKGLYECFCTTERGKSPW